MKDLKIYRFLSILTGIALVGVCLILGNIGIKTHDEHNIYKQNEYKLQCKLNQAQKNYTEQENYYESFLNDREFFEWVVRRQLGYSQRDEIIFDFNEERLGDHVTFE